MIVMKLSHRGLKIIAGYERFSSVPYICQGGKLTIGFGHVILPGENFTEITMEEGQELLKKDVEIAERAVNRYVSVEMNQDIFDALVSFTFNLGADNFRKSTLLKFLNSGQYYAAALEFCRWDNAGGKEQQGLEFRRAEEELLFVVGGVKMGTIV